MTSKKAAPATARKHAPRRHSTAPWPDYGFITVEMMMAALSVTSAQTVYNYCADDLLPMPERIGPTRIGWRVEVARNALDELPAKAMALRKARSIKRQKVAA
jgi:predicted DNA-binding transcriptional regulator AlpA